MTAFAVAMAWLVGSLLVAGVLELAGSEFAGVPMYVAAGCGAAVPVAFLLGRRFGPVVTSGRGIVIRMSLQTVLLTAGVVALAIALFVAFAAFATPYEGGLMEAAVRGTAGLFVYGLIAYVVGILIYGLPGLAIAAPSVYVWSRWMQRAFAPTQAKPAHG